MDELEEDWRYELLDPPHSGSPGYGRLAVSIWEKPTGKPYEPETLHLHLWDVTGMIRGDTLRGGTSRLPSSRVCPGRVMLADRVGNRVEFFAFGGSLELTVRPGELVYVLRSPVPILELTAEEGSVADQLAFETESLLGQVAARWGGDDQGFHQCLAKAAPLPLYVATVQTMLLRLESVEALATFYHELNDLLLRERRWLRAQELWPAEPLLLEDLLSPTR
jgi:hypothetical protein